MVTALEIEVFAVFGNSFQGGCAVPGSVYLVGVTVRRRPG
jgi:hypothetical protein